jgi:hypothetical protein
MAETMKTYLAGAVVRIELPRFEDAQQRPYDPDELSITVWPEDNMLIAEQFEYGPDREVVKLETGRYALDFKPPGPGVWRLAAYAPHPVHTSYFYAKPAPARV